MSWRKQREGNLALVAYLPNISLVTQNLQFNTFSENSNV
jgi:hypothetical protein